nr:hypothetical protein [Tanacetum cinerariifolium]
MASVIKSYLMVLPYAMLLTCLYRYVHTTQPIAITDIYFLVDHVIIPLIEGPTHRIMVDGKRPHPQTSSGSSPSPNPTPDQKENNPVDYYTLDLAVYINQLPPIPGGESPGFKQMKGMFKCFGHFLSNLKKKKYTNLALSITPPNISQSPLNQPIEASSLTPRALMFSTPSSSPIVPHPYLNSLEELPPRSSNPPPSPLNYVTNQTLPQPTLMDFEPSFLPTNLLRRNNRFFAQLKPFMSQEQILKEMGLLLDFSQNIEIALRNAQSVQNSLLPPITSSEMPPL